MKKPEQLPLDFSEAPEVPAIQRSNVASVVDLSSVRSHRRELSLGAVYEAIRDSVKHIDVRRSSRANAFQDSSHR